MSDQEADNLAAKIEKKTRAGCSINLFALGITSVMFIPIGCVGLIGVERLIG